MTRIAIPQPAASNSLKDNAFLAFIREGFRGGISRDELAVYALIGVMFLLGLVLLGVNAVSYQFTVWPVGMGLFTSLPILLAIWWFIGQVHRKRWPRFGLIAITWAQMTAFTVASTLACVAILTTPFVIIDYHLMAVDHAMGFDVTALMAWAHQYPFLIKVLSFSYDSWYYQIFLTPFILALLKKPKEISRYFMGCAICFIFCSLIFYFFPTIAPAGIVHSPYFVENQYQLVTRYYEIHQQLPVSTAGGGVVAFPSCHVMFSLLVLIAWRKIKFVFYPLLVLNTFLIIATMALGYHYLADVLMGFILVAVAVKLIDLFLKEKPNQTQSLGVKNS